MSRSPQLHPTLRRQMNCVNTLRRSGRGAGLAVVLGLVCGSLVNPREGFAGTPSARATGAPSPGMQQRQAAETTAGRSAQTHALTAQQRVLHALNRFTFGPTPGQAAAVEKLGLEAWFDQQLHPERIDDSALERRLDQYPAMRLSQAELVERFPTPGMLRRYANGALLMPADPTERVIYADASLSYEERKQAKVARKASSEAAQKGVELSTSGAAGAEGQESSTLAQNAVARAAQNAQQLQAGKAPVQDVEPLPYAAMSSQERSALLSLPPAARLERLLRLPPEQMVALQDSIRGPERQRLLAGFSPAAVEQVAAMRAPERVVVNEVLSTRLLRDVYSLRQLQAVMNDFWLNHFSLFVHKNQNEPYLLPAFEREAVMPNSLGRFEDLLVATAKSPAMLVYLDNQESVGPNSRAGLRSQANGAKGGNGKPRPAGINENYARELMELHTLGVKGGYTQQDVIEVAKCFTGWTVDRPADGGEFVFNPARHEPGDKTVLGHVIKQGGMNEGLEVLHLLATDPSTAHFVSLKLAQRFVSDTPPPALVDRMAQSFLHSQGDIRTVLLTLFHSREFWAPNVYRAKVKTPLEFLASALRSTGAEITQPEPAVAALGRLGMPVYGMQTPNGYSWLAEDWVSSNALLTRMNFALVLAGNRLGGTHLDLPSLVGEQADTAKVPEESTEQDLEMALLGQPASAQTRAAAREAASTPGVQTEAERSFRALPVNAAQPDLLARQGKKGSKGPALVANTPETPLATTAGLLLGSPEFQRR